MVVVRLEAALRERSLPREDLLPVLTQTSLHLHLHLYSHVTSYTCSLHVTALDLRELATAVENGLEISSSFASQADERWRWTCSEELGVALSQGCAGER